jgi:RNA polymerase sigma-70 factor (ECF subfamily)
VPLDAVTAEHRFAAEPALGPDELYERRWAMTLLDATLERLRTEFADAGRGAEFECLKEWLTADRGTIPYAEIAGRLGSSEGAARVAVHRLRARYREVFRDTVAATVDAEAEVETEMRHLVGVLSRA